MSRLAGHQPSRRTSPERKAAHGTQEGCVLLVAMSRSLFCLDVREAVHMQAAPQGHRESQRLSRSQCARSERPRRRLFRSDETRAPDERDPLIASARGCRAPRSVPAIARVRRSGPFRPLLLDQATIRSRAPERSSEREPMPRVAVAVLIGSDRFTIWSAAARRGHRNRTRVDGDRAHPRWLPCSLHKCPRCAMIGPSDRRTQRALRGNRRLAGGSTHSLEKLCRRVR
jgi:hypothetical protein